LAPAPKTDGDGLQRRLSAHLHLELDSARPAPAIGVPSRRPPVHQPATVGDPAQMSRRKRWLRTKSRTVSWCIGLATDVNSFESPGTFAACHAARDVGRARDVSFAPRAR
jgi:hypothetical protein